MALSQQWKDTVNRGIDDARWDEYDDTIRKEVSGMNRRLAATSQFTPLNWLFVKAMLWTESGGPDNPSWKKRAMQIGNPGDPAYQVLKDGKEGSALIMEPSWQKDFRTSIDKPQVNIRAAICYLYARLAKFENRSIPDPKDKGIHEYKVTTGDSLSSIASKAGTTLEELLSRNPAAKVMIKPGQVLKYRKAKMGLVIAGWRAISATEIANRYNGGGDPDYSAKLNYLLKDVFPKIKRDKK